MQSIFAKTDCDLIMMTDLILIIRIRRARRGPCI